jgi:hypothetical protein
MAEREGYEVLEVYLAAAPDGYVKSKLKEQAMNGYVQPHLVYSFQASTGSRCALWLLKNILGSSPQPKLMALPKPQLTP